MLGDVILHINPVLIFRQIEDGSILVKEYVDRYQLCLEMDSLIKLINDLHS